MTHRFNGMKQIRGGVLTECRRLNEVGEKIGTSKNTVDIIFTRLVYWMDKKSLRTDEECTAFMELNNITEEDIERHQR